MIEFSKLIIGTMRLGKWGAGFSTAEYERFIDQCLELGLKDFDHADIYGSYTTEEEFGKVLSKRPELRHKIHITTKTGIKLISENRPGHKVKSYDSSKKHILASVDASLKHFQTDYLDLLLIHRPDYLMAPEEIAKTISKLKEKGKIKHFGVSNFTVSQLEMLNKYIPIENHQLEFSLNQHKALDDGTLDQSISKKIKVTAWSPLGGGSFFDPTNSDQSDTLLELCNDLCEKYNCNIDQLLLAWVNKHPANLIPVLGTTKILRIVSALEALEIKLSHEDWYAMYSAKIGKEVD